MRHPSPLIRAGAIACILAASCAAAVPGGDAADAGLFEGGETPDGAAADGADAVDAAPCDAAGPPPDGAYAREVPTALIEVRRYASYPPASDVPRRLVARVDLDNDPRADGQAYEVSHVRGCLRLRYGAFWTARRAGTVSISARGRTWDLMLRGTATWPAYATEWRDVPFDTGDPIRIVATGEQAPPFDYSLVIPPPVEVIAPVAAAFRIPIRIPASEDLVVRWRGECPGGTVYARIVGNDPDGVSERVALCHFAASAGSGRFPTELLVWMRENGSANTLEIGTVLERLEPATPIPHLVRAAYVTFINGPTLF